MNPARERPLAIAYGKELCLSNGSRMPMFHLNKREMNVASVLYQSLTSHSKERQ